MNYLLNRRRTFVYAGALLASGPILAARSYPHKNVEMIVPYAAGGGTDAVARSFAEVSRKYFKQGITPINKPGASGSIGTAEVINSKPDGYKIALVTVEMTFLNSLGISRFTHENLVPIARLNYDPSAITVRADAPWKTIEEFFAAARKSNGEIRVGNAGAGSIW
ncbi:MAG: tripartite tricarboxylate transporter substrate-binding protein, partial [Janthinobacterium sp.]